MIHRSYATEASSPCSCDSTARRGVNPIVIGQARPISGDLTDVAIQRDSSLATLFGDQDYCATDECTSILSPAAYLCDLLYWLDHREVSGTPPADEPFRSAFDVLDSRRPDIKGLMLNCKNTDTVLPYIDLVNEILEDVVAGTVPTEKQTTWTEPALRAAPEHVNRDAYLKLRDDARYPQTLPYNWALDELRTWLGASGVPLWQLREELSNAPDAAVGIAKEWFKICSTEWDLLNGPHTDDAVVQAVWNTDDPAHDLLQLAPDPTAPDEARQPFFLRAAGISDSQLQELLKVEWVQEILTDRTPPQPRLKINGVDDSCNLGRQSLSVLVLDNDLLDRIHRFLRLWRHDTWKMWELDLLLRARKVANGELNETGLTNLFEFRRLQQTTGLPVDAQLALFQDIDRNDGAPHVGPENTRDTPLFARLFLNPSVLPPGDPAYLVFRSLYMPPPPSGTLPHLTEYRSVIQAALGVSASDLNDLFALVALDPETDELTVPNLSTLYRGITLARAAGMSPSDLATILPLAGLITIDPAWTHDELLSHSLAAALEEPQATRQFIEKVRIVEDSGFSGDEIVYVLTGIADNPVAMSDDGVVEVLTAVRQALQMVEDEIAAVNPVAALTTALGQLGKTQDESKDVLDIVTGRHLPSSGTPEDALNSLLGTSLSGLPSLSTPPAQDEQDARARAVLGALKIQLRSKVVIQTLHQNLDLEEAVVELLLSRLRDSSSDTLLSILTDDMLIDWNLATGAYTVPIRERGNLAGVPELGMGPQFLAIRRLHKIGVVVRRLHLDADEVQWLLDNPAVYGGLNLTSLPAAGDSTTQDIDHLNATVLLVQLDRLFNAAPNAEIARLRDLISVVAPGASESDAQSTLETLAGWRPGTVTGFADGLTYPADYRKPATYDRLRRLESMLNATGAADGTTLRNWASADDADIEHSAREVRDALRARYSVDEWNALAPKLIDPMRERRSAALQAYLTAIRDPDEPGRPLKYGDADGLFSEFLIDVQMSACALTSRVVQAYSAVQLFVERCFLGLEKAVHVARDDDQWHQWEWRDRYRVWEAARKVFLYPENWLIESQRPNRTDVFKAFESDVHKNESTRDYLESVVLDYVQGVEQLAHLQVSGMCVEWSAHPTTTHVIARTIEDPPRFYYRFFKNEGWSTWSPLTFQIHAHQVAPAVYRGRLYVFWPDIQVGNEPQGFIVTLASIYIRAGDSTDDSSGSKGRTRYVRIGLNFSVLHNGKWSPPARARAQLFDIPPELTFPGQQTDSLSIEALYSLKVLPGSSRSDPLQIDVFRQGRELSDDRGDRPTVTVRAPDGTPPNSSDIPTAIHIGRANFDGKFGNLAVNNEVTLVVNGVSTGLLNHAREAVYGPYVNELRELRNPEPPLGTDNVNNVVPRSGALVRSWSDPEPQQLEIDGGQVLNKVQPFRIVTPDSNTGFQPAFEPFFFQDASRCYYVKFTLTDGGARGYFDFSRFYHRYTKFFWHQLTFGGFPALYNPDLQRIPDYVDPSASYDFGDSNTYDDQELGFVSKDAPATNASLRDDLIESGIENPYRGVQFGRDTAFGAYNWELFYYVPLYVAERLSQNQKFEDALKWFRYLFDPTHRVEYPTPQSYWIPRPLYEIGDADQQRINELLQAVQRGDDAAVGQVAEWQNDPFNPFHLADLRPVAHMKRAVMSYLDNFIAWADNLFASDSREALNEATLLYLRAAEILGPEPAAVMPPQHPDKSFHELRPALDAFANALVEIENSVSRTRILTDAPTPRGFDDPSGVIIPPHPIVLPTTFYFKIPPNEKLLGYWKTVADRLFKLRHCQNIEGVVRELPLFDAPIDPGLLVKARAAGVDISSVLSDSQMPLPGYRFSALYPQALEFCEAVQRYGVQMLAALEKSDAAELELLLATGRKELSDAREQILEQRMEEADKQVEVLTQKKTLAKKKAEFASKQQNWNEWENMAFVARNVGGGLKAGVAGSEAFAAPFYYVPEFTAGFTPGSTVGGSHIGHALEGIAKANEAMGEHWMIVGDLLEKQGELQAKHEIYEHEEEQAKIKADSATAEIAGANLRAKIASDELSNHRTRSDQLQQEIDFLSGRFTSQDLYDWMVGRLSDTYYQSYRLAYRLCKQVERCFRYELGLVDQTSGKSFIQFGHWDSLKKGLLAGEALSLDLRRMNAAYLERNTRRFEITSYVSLKDLDAWGASVDSGPSGSGSSALDDLKSSSSGTCHFMLEESRFDADYPGHYLRRLQRVSVTVVCPDAAPHTNIPGVLTLLWNTVRHSTRRGSGYERTPPADDRFKDEYGAVPQKIALSNGQDDAGMFFTEMRDNLRDPRYLPFEGAGAISFWEVTLRPPSNTPVPIHLSSITDVILKVAYTALDGGPGFGP